MRVDIGVNTDMDESRSPRAVGSIDRHYLEADQGSLMQRAKQRIAGHVKEQVQFDIQKIWICTVQFLLYFVLLSRILWI
jgi:hypothetical protein